MERRDEEVTLPMDSSLTDEMPVPIYPQEEKFRQVMDLADKALLSLFEAMEPSIKSGSEPTYDSHEDLRRSIKERYYSKLRKQKLLRTGSLLGSRQEAFVVDADDIDYLSRRILKSVTFGGQSPTLQAFGGCHGSILPKPRRIVGGHRSGTNSLPTERVCPIEVRSRMCDEFHGLAHVDSAINTAEEREMCDLRARVCRPPGLHGNIFGEGTSMMYDPVSCGASPSCKSDGHIHEHARSIWLESGRLSLDGTAELTQSHSKSETMDQQFSQARGGHRPDHLKLTSIIGGDGSGLKSSAVKATPPGSFKYDGPTTSKLSGEGTSRMHNHGSSGEVISFGHQDRDIEMGGMHSPGHTHRHIVPIAIMPNVSDEITSEPSPADLSASEHVQGRQRLVPWGDSSSNGSAHEDRGMEMAGTRPSDGVQVEQRLSHEDKWQRLATMLDPLLGVIVQSACSFVAYQSSNGSSPAKDVLFYALVGNCVLGFVFALAGKWFRCSKMGVIGLMAAALGFLITMALVVICKIG